MKKFWKATLIPGLCCILAGAVLAAILVLGFSDELMEHRKDFSINENNFFEWFGKDAYIGINRGGTHYDKSETTESYYFQVEENSRVTGIEFEFAVGEVEVKKGETMELAVEDMFENAITSRVADGIWYIDDSLINSGSVHSGYSPKISITIPAETDFETINIYLAAGMFEAYELNADKMVLEVDAGSMKVTKLSAKEKLDLKNGVGEIRVYDATAEDLTVDNGIGAISITGAINGNNVITCGIGEVKVNLTDRSSVDFNYSVECGIGEVEIDEKKFSGNTRSVVHEHAGADYFELECGIGHIEINVE